MDREDLWRIFFQRLLQATAGFLCSLISIYGYYPLVPAAMAAACTGGNGQVFMVVGLLAGMLAGMSLAAAAKYGMLIIVIFVAVRFYLWINKSCSQIAAGLIAGAAVMAMNLSGGTLSGRDAGETIWGVSEGFLAAGFTMLFHYIGGRGTKLKRSFRRRAYAIRKEGAVEGVPAPAADGRIEALMTAVDGLSEVFTSLSRPRASTSIEEAGVLTQELEGTLCASCDSCSLCWQEQRGQRLRDFQELFLEIIGNKSREELLEDKKVEECSKYPDLVEEAMRAFGRMELNQAWYLRLLENRQVVAQHLDAMAELLQGWSKAEHCVDAHSRLLMARIAYEVRERGILLKNLHIYENGSGRRYIRAMAASKWDGGIPMKKYLEALERASRTALRLERSAGTVITSDWMPVTVFEDTEYYTLPGVAMQKKDSSPISGDNFTMFELEDGSYIIGLSDGMGSGSRANQESAMVVDLLERLIKAGFARDIAIRMMNSAMVLQGENESYSTLDMATMNLYTGQVSLVKIGAAASFLRRDGEVKVLAAKSLPAGADPAQKPGEVSFQAKHGDFLVMVSDGVLEYLHVEDPGQYFGEMIKKESAENAGVLAKSLLEQVLKKTGGYVQDDMTILVTGIWEKN